jgi:type I restriction enzyme R subunit
MKSFEEYYNSGYEDEKGNLHRPYIALIKELLESFPVEGLANIFDEEEKKRFIRLFSEILRLRNILTAFDEFTEDKMLVPMMTFNDYLGWYNSLHDEFRPTTHDEHESISDDIVFEMELVKQVQVNIHYILMLVQKYHDSNCRDKEIIVKIRKEIDASPDMRDKRDLIMKFIDSMTPGQGGDDIGGDWEEYIEEQKRQQLKTIIKEENLKPAETEEFMNRAFRDGYVTETGTGIAKILPAADPFLPQSGDKKQTVIDKLKAYLKMFLNTSD